MRVTTQMLNNAAAKAGIPVNRSSLLNYINGNSSNVSLANSLSKTQKADSAKKANYDKLETSADEVVKSMDKLMTAEGGNVTASDLQSFVDHYNEMLKSLSKTSDTLNNFYAQTVKDTVKGCQKELEQLGITMEKDGSLSFNKEKFAKFRAELSAQAADTSVNEATEKTEAGDAAEVTDKDAAEDASSEDIETADAVKSNASNLNTILDTLFNQKSGLFSKLKLLATHISDNANANAKSFSNYYNGYGTMKNAYSNGKYNFWS